MYSVLEGMVEHACNHYIKKLRQEEEELETNLGYIFYRKTLSNKKIRKVEFRRGLREG